MGALDLTAPAPPKLAANPNGFDAHQVSCAPFRVSRDNRCACHATEP